ncbi:guanylate kinase [bacterium]|nr:guanylate kinase [Parcubacteria group bacterium]MBF05153.1 guanylate kinase [bacterium]|tara:strand:+ start:32236 stop:32805 length:570 start_codon:yes stop_codon:yes gene_type:complete
MQLNNIVIISGPSGVGEDSVIEGLRTTTAINRVVTTTTRAPRKEEKEGHPYSFISKEEFEQKIKDGEMVEWAKQYNGNFYGVTKEELQRVNDLEGVGVWKIEYQGVITAKKLFPEIKAILLSAESLEVLEERIRSRGEVSDKFVAERIQYTQEWLKHVDIYDYTVINKQGLLRETIQEVVDILRKEQYL